MVTPPVTSNPAHQGGTLHESIAVDDITTGYRWQTSAMIGGLEWSFCARRRTPDDGVEKLVVYVCCLTAKKRPEVEVNASYIVRLIGTETIAQYSVELSKYSATSLNVGVYIQPWDSVTNPDFGFCVDGLITIEVELTVCVPKLLPPLIDPSSMKIINLDDPRFADMFVKVKGDDWEGVHCHKAVVCQQSEAIYGAMSSATAEAASGTFEIGDECATVDGVRQLVRLIYGEYDKEAMDDHAVELFVLGDVLLCNRVKHLAVLAIIRLLSVDTFWATMKAAVRIDDQYVVYLCASFANESRQRLWDLINNEDGKEIMKHGNVKETKAVMVLLEAVGEMNKKPLED